jgi:hypothetical protein
MSLIEIALSRPEIIIVLAAIGLLVLASVLMLVVPPARRAWRRKMAERRAEKAARLAKLKKANAKRNAQAARRGVIVSDPALPPAVTAEEASVSLPASTGTAAAASAPAAVSEPAAQAQPAAGVQPAAEAPAAAEAQPTETVTEDANSMQDILNSVFADDESASRFEVMLQGIEPITADELLEMANKIAAQLRAQERAAV